MLKGNIPHEQFDSKKWKNWQETEWDGSLRWDMMNSLRNTYKLKGQTKTEITELLGTPNTETDLEFGYYLGMAKSGIDTGHLTIKFNRNGIVTNYNVTRS